MMKIQWKSKKMLIVAALAIILSAAGGAYLMTRAIPVQTALVSLDTVEAVVTDTGTLRSEAVVELTAYGSAQVQDILVEIGERVRAGDVLLILDDTALQLQLAALGSEMAAIQADLDYLSSRYGDLTVESATDSARIARENFEKAKKDYEDAQWLHDSGAISRAELDSYEMLYNVSRMNYTIALNSADTATGAQNTQLSQLEYRLQSLSAQLDQVRLTADRYAVKAPFDGIVSARYLDEKDFAAVGTPLLQVYKEAYFMEVNLIEDDLVLLGPQTPVSVQWDGGWQASGIIRIHPTILKTLSDLGVTQLKGTVEIVAPEGATLVGQETEVMFVTATAENAVTVDRGAIIRIGGETAVYRIENGKARLVPVELGIRGTATDEVLSGLEAGDEVILNPGEEIADGVKVKK